MSTPRDLGSTDRWTHSLRVSQARRAAAAKMRTWSRRRRVTASTLAVAVLGFGGVAAAQTTTGGSDGGSGSAQTASAGFSLKAVQGKLGVTADGQMGPQTRRAIRSFQRKNGLQVDGVVGPQTLKALGLAAGASTRSATTKTAAASSSSGTANATLEKIAACESGGDPSAVSSNGTYRGKYQFSRQTWRAYGGSGDPAAASEAEQDRIAAKLLAAEGTKPWPVCGK
ncbi:transglycosylase family protein [Patulibacter sp. SYSU D01012]|uniref:transglycosylase family protein n=1 Tax=Patulibacter sp. SYSU D01012 TaxID=2817381 RepID=UPI001B300A75